MIEDSQDQVWPYGGSFDSAMKNYQHDLIIKSLKLSAGNRTNAAKRSNEVFELIFLSNE